MISYELVNKTSGMVHIIHELNFHCEECSSTSLHLKLMIICRHIWC